MRGLQVVGDCRYRNQVGREKPGVDRGSSSTSGSPAPGRSDRQGQGLERFRRERLGESWAAPRPTRSGSWNAGCRRSRLREYEVDPDDLAAETVARKVGLPAEQVFKTLVARGDKQGVCLAVVPGDAEPHRWRAQLHVRPWYAGKMAQPETVKSMIARFKDKPLEFLRAKSSLTATRVISCWERSSSGSRGRVTKPF